MKRESRTAMIVDDYSATNISAPRLARRVLFAAIGLFAITVVDAETPRDFAEDVWAFDVVPLAIERDGAALRVAVPLDGVLRDVTLQPHSLRGSDFAVYVPDGKGELVVATAPSVTTYRGLVAGAPGKDVAASLIDGKLHALILDTNGDRHVVEPMLALTAANSEETKYAIYAGRDLVAGTAVCGADSLLGQRRDSTDSIDGSAITNGAGVNGHTEIAFDADYEFYINNGSSMAAVVADIEMILNQVDMVYSTQTGICYTNAGIIVRNSAADPYTSSNPGTLLCEFGDEWNANVSIPRDVAHLMTGRELDGITIGVAWNRVICPENYTNCAGGRLDYGLSESDYNYPSMTPLAGRVGLTAHELGHNWSGCHCDDGACTGGGADNDCGIMNSILNGSLMFNARSVAAITSHRDTRPCLDVCATGGLLGDMNCDGTVTVSDIGGFVLALTDPTGYAMQFPDCDINNADVNEDGSISVSDIGPFVALLTM